jgi:hypothetical protein
VEHVNYHDCYDHGDERHELLHDWLGYGSVWFGFWLVVMVWFSLVNL